jgi:hypothetical protein
MLTRKEWNRIRAMHILKEMHKLVKYGEDIPREYDEELAELVTFIEHDNCALVPNRIDNE